MVSIPSGGGVAAVPLPHRCAAHTDTYAAIFAYTSGSELLAQDLSGRVLLLGRGGDCAQVHTSYERVMRRICLCETYDLCCEGVCICITGLCAREGMCLKKAYVLRKSVYVSCLL